MHRRTYALLVVAALATACSDDAAPALATTAAEPGPATSATAPDTGTHGLAEGWSVAGALAEVPDTGGTFDLVAADLAAIGTVLGATPPELSAGADAVLDEWVLPLTFPALDVEYRELPVWVDIPAPIVPAIVPEVAEFDDLLGWSIVDVDSFVHYQPEPPGYFAVVAGAFADDALAGLPSVADDVVSTHDGDELAPDLEGDRVVDQLGRPVRLARDGNRIALSLTSALAERWVAGEAGTLADDAAATAVAAALDRAGVFAAHLFRHDFAFDAAAAAVAAGPDDPAGAIEAAHDATGVDTPFGTVGIGWTVDAAATPRVIVAYAAADPEAAATLAEQLEPLYTAGSSLMTGVPLTELLGADTFAITVDGSVVSVSYAPVGRPWSTPVDMVFTRDLPFVYR